MAQKKLILVVFFSFLSIATQIFAMDGFGPQQEKQIKELSKELFKSIKKSDDVYKINQILGENSSFPESYRAVLLKKRNKKGKTLLQKAFHKTNDVVNDLWYIGPRYIHFYCGEQFKRLWELGADIKEIPAKDLAPHVLKLFKNGFLRYRLSLAKTIFAHSAELNEAIIKRDGGESLLLSNVQLGASASKEVIELVLMQPGMMLSVITKVSAKCSRDDAKIISDFLKRNNDDALYTGWLANSIALNSLEDMRKTLLSVKDETAKKKEATEAVKYLLSIWRQSLSENEDIVRTKMIGILVIHGASFSHLGKDALLAKSEFHRHNLLHSAACVGGEFGAAIAKELLAHSASVGTNMMRAKNDLGETPLEVAKAYRSQAVVDVLAAMSSSPSDTTEVSLSVMTLD